MKIPSPPMKIPSDLQIAYENKHFYNDVKLYFFETIFFDKATYLH